MSECMCREMINDREFVLFLLREGAALANEHIPARFALNKIADVLEAEFGEGWREQ